MTDSKLDYLRVIEIGLMALSIVAAVAVGLAQIHTQISPRPQQFLRDQYAGIINNNFGAPSSSRATPEAEDIGVQPRPRNAQARAASDLPANGNSTATSTIEVANSDYLPESEYVPTAGEEVIYGPSTY